jgi:peptidoglycan hydrolase-like protein with peptidoglycan-binding domain
MAKRKKDNFIYYLLGLVSLAFALSPRPASAAGADLQPEPSPAPPARPNRWDAYTAKLQRFLNRNQVFPLLSPDGRYGPKTNNNVRLYLQRTGISPAQLRARVEAWPG